MSFCEADIRDHARCKDEPCQECCSHADHEEGRCECGWECEVYGCKTCCPHESVKNTVCNDCAEVVS